MVLSPLPTIQLPVRLLLSKQYPSEVLGSEGPLKFPEVGNFDLYVADVEGDGD